MKKIFPWFSFINTLVNIILFVISCLALWIAIETKDSQNLQYEQNAKSSDSLFNV